MKYPVLLFSGVSLLLGACQSSLPDSPRAAAPSDPIPVRVAFQECDYAVELPWSVERLSYVSTRGTDVIEYRADRRETGNTLPDYAYFAAQCYVTDSIEESDVRQRAYELARSSGASDYSVVPLVGPQNQSVYTSIGRAGFRVMQWLTPDDRIVVIYAAEDYADQMFGSIEPI